MKIKITNFRVTGLLFVCLLMLISNVRAQISFTGSSLTYSQNFDAVTGTLPTGITQNGSATAGTAATSLGSTSSGGAYVFVSGTDKAIGFLNSGSYTTGKYIVAQFTNNTGSVITALAVSFDYEKYRAGNRAWTFNFSTSTNGSSYTANASGTQTWASDGANGSGIFPPQVTSKSFSITGLSIPNGTSYYMRWQLDGSGGSTNGQALAIDNLVVTATAGAIKPEVINPTATNIADISARLGATVSSAGDSAITARGIVWSTSANPEIGSPGVTQVNVDGTTGVFDSLVSGLPPATQIFYRGFATSGAGTIYTTTASFYTLATSPMHVTNLAATAVSNHDIGLKWTPSPDANGYIVIQKLYTAPNSFPQDRMRYKEGDMIGDGEVIDTILNPNADTAFYPGLISGTVYQYALVPFRFSAVSTETYNYNTDLVPLAFDTTWGVGPSALSDIAGVPQSEANTISSVITGQLTTGNTGAKVWQLSLRDGGAAMADADDMPTSVTRMVIVKGKGNRVANWSNILAYAALYDDSTGAKVSDATIYKDSLVFNTLNWVAYDNNQKTLTLRVSLKTSGIIDLDSFCFAVKKATIKTPSLNVSSQIPDLDIQSDSLKNVVDVIATKIAITQQPPSSTGINVLLPQIKAMLTDSNGNVDLYHTNPYHLTSDISMQYPQVKQPVSGVLVFDSVSFTSLANASRLKIWGAGLDTAYTNPVSVFASSQSIIKASNDFAYADSILYASYQSAAITGTNSVAVFGLTMIDGGLAANDGDNFGTTLSSLSLNTVGYAFIRSLALYQGTTKLAEKTVSSGAVTFNNLNIIANDNDSVQLVIRATFNSRYAHGQRVSFSVSAASADTASGSVFASLNAGGAASPVSGAVNILKYIPLNVAPPQGQELNVCAGSAAMLKPLKPAGTTLYWYTSETAAVPLFAADSVVLNKVNESVSYYVAADSSGWMSNKVKVSVNVQKVADPLVSALTVCKGSPATIQANSSHTIRWYNTFGADQPVASGNSFNAGSINADTVFYIQADSASCLSKRIPAAIYVARVQAPAVKDTFVCKAQGITLQASGNHAINWFCSLSSTVVIHNGQSLSTGLLQRDTTYYAESDSSGCASPRRAVKVSVKNVPAPVLENDSQNICSGNTATFRTTGGTTVNWYTSETASTPLTSGNEFSTPALSLTTKYYAAAIAGGCLSERKPVTANVNAIPALPVVEGDSVCMGDKLVLEAASVVNVKWYDAETGGNLVGKQKAFTTPAININTVYYAEAEANGCSSSRVTVPVSVKTKPAVPVVLANRTSCSGMQLKLGAFSAAGRITWFAALTDTTAIGNDSLLTGPLAADVTYYAAAQLNGCVSNRATVKIKVTATPDPVFTINETEQCLESNRFTCISGSNPPSTQYTWLFGDSTTFGFMNPVKSYLKKGRYTITLKANNDGCTSEHSKQVTVSAPDVDFTYTVSGGTVIFTPVASGISTYKWHFSGTDSAATQQAEFTFTANGTYPVTLVVTDQNGCSSSITKTIVISTTGLAEFNALYQPAVYPNPFKETLRLRYTLPGSSDVKIRVLDATGRLVKELLDGKQAAGVQELKVDLEQASGLYFLQMNINNNVSTIRLIAE